VTDSSRSENRCAHRGRLASEGLLIFVSWGGRNARESDAPDEGFGNFRAAVSIPPVADLPPNFLA
jgi:hypothetical protein